MYPFPFFPIKCLPPLHITLSPLGLELWRWRRWNTVTAGVRDSVLDIYQWNLTFNRNGVFWRDSSTAEDILLKIMILKPIFKNRWKWFQSHRNPYRLGGWALINWYQSIPKPVESWQLPCDVAKFYGNSLRHVPLTWEHSAIFLLVVHELAFDPGIATVDFVQPGNLGEAGNKIYPST